MLIMLIMLIFSELFLIVYSNHFELENGIMTKLKQFYHGFLHAYVLPNL